MHLVGPYYPNTRLINTVPEGKCLSVSYGTSVSRTETKLMWPVIGIDTEHGLTAINRHRVLVSSY